MTSNRKGFTLIELLIVVVIIGILAAIAIPKFSNTKEKAYLAAMKSDLRNLAAFQENYFADQPAPQTYAPDYATASAAGYTISNGVTVTITGAGNGWNATATHGGLPATKDCVLWQGDVAFQVQAQGTAAAANEGVIQCSP